ncbi:hypothetical protein BS50DRAFT_572587 [Corynespora cassiicola Philippines]|uniref:Uncharacterized protein n=1 Tax=Corynespora cassiicola Philippines TaxID=1448308 RepID=A0A2T2NVR3_CORCC|nr:hypothetical protein BS50DRAFT_572587 [Corynespora cassiicola Philippines]
MHTAWHFTISSRSSPHPDRYGAGLLAREHALLACAVAIGIGMVSSLAVPAKERAGADRKSLA